MSYEYNTVLVCAMNKLSLILKVEEDREVNITDSSETSGSVRHRRYTTADSDGDTATGMSDPPFLPSSSFTFPPYTSITAPPITPHQPIPSGWLILILGVCLLLVLLVVTAGVYQLIN